MSKPMNIFLWVLQILLAFYNISGGLYMVSHYKILANAWAMSTLPQPVWVFLGLVQFLFALGLVVPGVIRSLSKLVAVSAAGLAVLSLLGSILYATYGGSGILWAIVPAIILGFVAYERFV